MKLRLHNYWISSCSHRVRIALALKGLAYDYVAVDIVGAGAHHEDDFRARNPMQQVPALELVDEAGAVRHAVQSLPIIELLEELHPEPALLPADPFLRARARALAEIVNSGIQPHQNLTTQRGISALGGDGRAWAQRYIRDGLVAFAALATGESGRYCIGDSPTVADCFLVPQVHSARRLRVDLSGLEELCAIADRADETAPFAAALPLAQPDAPGRSSS